ncbi:MAG: AAA family ATPase [Kofleriaceae bacterium]|nr:AAA family ATPase [Kofleriaceae bacterium]
MLESLALRNVGPAAEMDLEFGSRLNLITGDNGLGKSFLLDVAWWALTRRWPQDLNANLNSGYAARPRDLKSKATLAFSVKAKSRSIRYESEYLRRDQSWQGKAGRPGNPGLVLYALADGGFAVWDPARNYWRKRGGVDVQERVPAYVFGAKEVWDGLVAAVDDVDTVVCNGLLRDWASWIRERGADAERMAGVLRTLAPDVAGEVVQPGKGFARLSVSDARDIPTVHMGYGQDVPILHASLGVRRIVALSYMLAWAWREHLIAADALGEEPSTRVVLLFDEIEAHLHPKWQRAIVPALLEVVQTLTSSKRATVQLIAATHSPLVLASVEPSFDPATDAWFDLDLEDSAVHLRKRPFVRHGDVSNWLTSEAFDLQAARSRPAEDAIREAFALLRVPQPSRQDVMRVDGSLRASRIPELDPFWVRWGEFVAKHGSQATGTRSRNGRSR